MRMLRNQLTCCGADWDIFDKDDEIGRSVFIVVVRGGGGVPARRLVGGMMMGFGVWVLG